MYVEDDDLFYINFKTQMVVGSGEPNDFLSHYQGDVELYDTERDKPICAAKLSVFLVHADAAERAGMPLYDVLDADSKTAPFLALLHESEAGNFSSDVLGILKDDFAMSRDMIILDRIEILPEFRGKRLAYRVTQGLVDRWAAGNRIVALKAFPLQFEFSTKKRSDKWGRRMKFGALPKGRRKAAARLKKYYSNMGFVSVRGTDLMIRDLCVSELSIR